MRDGGVGTTHGEERAPPEDNTNVCLCPVFESPAALKDLFNLWGRESAGDESRAALPP